MNGSTPLTTEQPRLIVLMGYPASGKTTLARHMQDRDLGLARVNRDDIRSMIGLPYNRTLEAIVRWIEVELVRRLLANGISVIVDDTNLKWETRNNWGVVAGACTRRSSSTPRWPNASVATTSVRTRSGPA